MERHESSRGLLPVFVRTGRSRTKYKAGFIDTSGAIVVPPVYDYAHPFRNDRAAVRIGEAWGAIDELGNLVIPPRFSGPLTFTEGLAEFSLPSDNRGVVDLAGDVVIPARYQFVSHFTDGIACVRSGDLYGFIDRLGREIIPPFFEDARAFSEGLAAVKLGGKWGYISPDGMSAIVPQFICKGGMAGPFRQGLARVAKDDKWGHINSNAEFVVTPRFDMALEFSEGMAEVRLGKKSGFVNLLGELVIDTIYNHVGRFSEGLARVNVGTGEAHKSIKEACENAFIDETGQFVIQPRFFSAGSFQLGRCLVITERDIGYITREGDFIWKSGWVEIGFIDPHHLFPREVAQRMVTS